MSITSNGKYLISVQKEAKILYSDLERHLVIKEIDGKNVMCLDVNATGDTLVLGRRNGIITIYYLVKDENENIVDFESHDMVFHTQLIIDIRLSPNKIYGVSGGLDSYIGFWHALKRTLLYKIPIDFPLKTIAINLEGSIFIYALQGQKILYHCRHYRDQKALNNMNQFKVSIYEFI
jgi:WD40 repeat protein